MRNLAILLTSMSCATATLPSAKYSISCPAMIGCFQPSEVDTIADLAVELGICQPDQLKGLVVKPLPVDRFSCQGLSSVGCYNDDGSVTVAVKAPFKCRTLLHEYAHKCGHSHLDPAVYVGRPDGNGYDLIPSFKAAVAKVCP